MTMHNPAHPGSILLEEVLKPSNLSITKASEHLGVSRKTLSAICNGRAAITSETARRLEIVFNAPSADMWLRMQNAYDLYHLRKEKLSATPIAA